MVVILIAYPLFGINVGGTITACIALGGVTLISLYKNTFSYKDIICVIVGTVFVISVNRTTWMVTNLQNYNPIWLKILE